MKFDKVLEFLTVVGRLFHIRGPKMANALSPNFVAALGTMRSPRSADRREPRASSSLTDRQSALGRNYGWSEFDNFILINSLSTQ